MTEKVKIGTKEFKIIHNDDGTKDVSLKGYTGKYYTIYKKVSEFINLGWWYIIKHDDWVDVPSEFWGTLAKKMHGSKRFRAEGKIGCEDDSGVILPAIFDQIEFLKGDRFFMLSGSKYYLISPKRGESSTYEYHNSKFYENDHVGWRGDGEVIIPAEYDDVNKLWGLEVYETVKDGGYRYLNREGNEILTQKKEEFVIGPNEPYP